MSYEFDYQLLDALTDNYGLVFEHEEAYVPEIKGMRALDYQPDMDDYETLQSLY